MAKQEYLFYRISVYVVLSMSYPFYGIVFDARSGRQGCHIQPQEEFTAHVHGFLHCSVWELKVPINSNIGTFNRAD